MSETKHTPGKVGASGCAIYSEKTDQPICIASGPATIEERIANTNHLALCWNSHDTLLKACKEAKSQIEFSHKTDTGYAHFTPVHGYLTAAISAGESKE